MKNILKRMFTYLGNMMGTTYRYFFKTHKIVNVGIIMIFLRNGDCLNIVLKQYYFRILIKIISYILYRSFCNIYKNINSFE